jgi:hypothetical protein
MEPTIKVYIRKGSIFKHNGKYNAFVTTNGDYLEKDADYYEYTLKLPTSEISRIEKLDEVEPEKIKTSK